MSTVTLHLAGLFVLVRHQDGLYALAPRTDHHAHGEGGSIPRHVAFLLWSTGDGSLTGVPFDGFALRLHPPGAATSLHVPDDQIDLDRLTGRTLQRRLVEDPLDGRRLLARVDLGITWDTLVSLRSEQFIVPADGGGTQTCWQGVWATLTRRIDSPFGLQASLVNGTTVMPLPLPLQPDLTLACLHVPEDLLRDLGPAAPSGGPVTHFQAYYDLYDAPPPPHTPEIGVPLHAGAPPLAGAPTVEFAFSSIEALFDRLGGTTKTCPTARGTVA